MSQKTSWAIIAFIFIFGLWELGSRIFAANLVLVLPPPSKVFWQVWYRADRLTFHTLATVKVMLGGFTLAFLIAFPLAWTMQLWQTWRIILQPIFVAVQCIPMFALAPIMVLWFGWSYIAIVVPTTLMIFFPLTMNIYQGLRSTPTHYIDYFRSNQATDWQIFYKLQLPWALPHLFAGFRIAAAIAGIGAVAGEWAGAQKGLGMLMLESRRGADLEMMLAALFCLGGISFILYAIIAWLEKEVLSRKFVHLLQTAKRMGCFAALFLGIATFQGCQQQEPNQETRLVLDWLANPNHVPLYVGIEKGFFAENGVPIQILKVFDPSNSLPYLTSGQTDLAISYMPSSIRAQHRGAKIVPIGILIDKPLNAFIYRRDSGIKTPSDMNDKVIGYCVDGFGTTTLNFILNRNGICVKDKLNVSFDLAAALGTKQVDVIYGAFWNIECEQLKHLGIASDHFELMDLGYPRYYELLVFARENSTQSSPHFVAQFQKALQTSIDYCQKNPEEAFEIYKKANPDKGDITIAWESSAWKATSSLFSNTQQIDETTWNTFVAWMKSQNII